MAWKKKIVPVTTNNITTAIVNFLLSEGHSASRVNVQGQYDEEKKGWRPSGSRKGFLDIDCVLKPYGRSLNIDVKKGKDALRKPQKDFIKEIESAGGLTFIAEDYEHFLNWYQEDLPSLLCP